MTDSSKGSGVTGGLQDNANQLVKIAQQLANDVVDVGQEGAGMVFAAAISANQEIGNLLKALGGKLGATGLEHTPPPAPPATTSQPPA